MKTIQVPESAKPILFNTEMVKAILKGKKTQTRRFINNRFQTGNMLYVKETWCYAEDENGNHSSSTKGDCFGKYLYKANDDKPHGIWKPSIYMPKEAGRIFLRIKNIYLQNLQEITEQEAIKEGVEYLQGLGFKNYLGFPEDYLKTAVESFKSLWSLIYGVESWEQNPKVYVIEFEKIPAII